MVGINLDPIITPVTSEQGKEKDFLPLLQQAEKPGKNECVIPGRTRGEL